MMREPKAKPVSLRMGLLCATALLTSLATAGPVMAQQAASSAQVALDIPAQPLGQALNRIADAMNLRLVVASSLLEGRRSNPVSGNLTAAQALAQAVSGTGLVFEFVGENAVRISDPRSGAAAPVENGSGLLGHLLIAGTSGTAASYETPAATSFIGSDTITNFRGSNPGDMFRGTPGVRSGDTRNGGAAIDVNVRGMQGMGRVQVTVDGAENNVAVYQGYQGMSNRSFVDPDLIAEVDINRGASATSFGNAGSVEIRTITARDIVRPGQRWGLRLRSELGDNNSTPVPGQLAGQGAQAAGSLGYIVVDSTESLHRPSTFNFGGRSGSAALAYQGERFDVLLGYARRERGNYHAGSHGRTGDMHNDPSLGRYCATYNAIGECTFWRNPNYYYYNNGIANYRAGEEVLNTALTTESLLLRANFQISDEQRLEFGHSTFTSIAGDRLASQLSGPTAQPVQSADSSETELVSTTLRYRWNPQGNDLIDLRANLWRTEVNSGNLSRNGVLGGDGSETLMWGFDVTNTSAISFTRSDLTLHYGVAYRNEHAESYTTIPASGATWVGARTENREELAAFLRAQWDPAEWLSLTGGLRYTQFSGDGRLRDRVNTALFSEHSVEASGLSPSFGITISPSQGTQIFLNYAESRRAPALYETNLLPATFGLTPNAAEWAAVTPERSRNWELGANWISRNRFAEGDNLMVKLNYFNWNVRDYISRSTVEVPNEAGGSNSALALSNINRARFEGIELASRYQIGGFTADLAANYYLGVEYCYTAASCSGSTLYGDYATNHVPPRYSVDLTVSQRFLDDRLTLGGRVSHFGPRAIGHGDVTMTGASEFISQVQWDPDTIVDLFANYSFNDRIGLSARVENLTDRFYVDPLGLVSQPAPGRTIYLGLDARF